MADEEMGTRELLGRMAAHMNVSGLADDFNERHGIAAAPFLTITSDEEAAELARHLAPRIEGRIVVEIGGGLGLLALHMGRYARRVFCIEANPVWASGFAVALLAGKPRNVSYLFGSADEFAGQIRGDVAVYCSHSGLAAMREAAGKFAREVVDVWGELIAQHPERFDGFARLRDSA